MKNLVLAISRTSAERSRLGWAVLRVALALLIAAHGWARLVAGGVVPFGGFLDSQGYPFGIAWAAAVTGLEIGGSVALALRRFVLPLSLVFSLVYAMDVALVHPKAGWFVVGLGRNGSEYSVLLIIGLPCVGLQNAKVQGEA